MGDVSRLIGRALRESREEAGLSQEALADIAGINRSYLGDLERGMAQPTIITLEKIADGLKVRLSDLIRRCEQMSDG